MSEGGLVEGVRGEIGGAIEGGVWGRSGTRDLGTMG